MSPEDYDHDLRWVGRTIAFTAIAVIGAPALVAGVGTIGWLIWGRT